MRRRLAVTSHLLAALAVTLVALWVRLVAVELLPIDFDEDDYLRAGQIYATGFQQGDPGVLLRENYRPEHPPLTKIVTGLAIARLPAAPEIPDQPTDAPPADSLPEPLFTVARVVQATEGTAAVAALAVLDPVAGLVLAVDTWNVKYTSQIMLEALPALLALLAVLAALKGSKRSRPRRRRAWWIASAVALGLACAGKYPYALAGVAIALAWLWEARPARWRDARALWRWLAPVGGWTLLAVAVFVAADPYLWPDPVGRLWSSLTYHIGYAGSDAVQNTGWPSWQPLVWLMGSVPFHAPGTFLVALDLPIAVLAIVGFRRTWRHQRPMALWLLLDLAFLMLWPTKWPQYLLMLTAPLALAAGHGARAALLEPLGRALSRLAARVRDIGAAAWRLGGQQEPDGATNTLHTRAASRESARTRFRGARELRHVLPWLAPGALALVVLAVVPLVYQAAMALTDFQATSIRDGINGGVVREGIAALTSQSRTVQFDPNHASNTVNSLGFDLLGQLTSGIWFGGNTTARYAAFSLLWMVVSILTQAGLGLGIALVLESPGVRFVPFWRTLFILPWAIPEFVGAIAWRTIFQPNGGWLSLLVGHPVDWRASPDFALAVLLIAATWMGFPIFMLVATAGLRTVPAAVQEAASVDGAGRWSRLRHVTLPLLLPLLAPAVVIRGVAAFNQFYLFYVLAPPDSTTTLATFSYSVFDSTRGPGLFAVSAAINLLTIVALSALVIWFLRWRERAERVAFV